MSILLKLLFRGKKRYGPNSGFSFYVYLKVAVTAGGSGNMSKWATFLPSNFRYLYFRWGMDLSKVVVFIGENGDLGYEGNLGGVHKSIIPKGVGNAINDQHRQNRIHPLSDVWCSVYCYYFLFTLDGCLLFSLNMSAGIISIL
ncbi:putative sucrose-phosphate synthase [Helianthus anomalus]